MCDSGTRVSMLGEVFSNNVCVEGIDRFHDLSKFSFVATVVACATR